MDGPRAPDPRSGKANALDEAAPDAAIDELVTKNARLATIVDELAKARIETLEIVATAGGRVDHATESAGQRIDMGLRVPVAALEPTVDRLAELGEVRERTLSTENVTAEVLDLDARITNLRSLSERLRALLDRTTEIDEILRIEAELTRVQSELDSLESRVARLRGLARMSSISLTLERQRPKQILGPIGQVWKWTWWSLGKLFVIRDGPA